jgi:hypothetical protein
MGTDKEMELIDRTISLLKRAKEKGLTKEQKHIDSEDSPEKEYWHYGYAMALFDVCKNFKLTEI